MKSYKVSIIIPIYGVEQSIARCAHSLFKQTFDDLEYIFVDDNTKDKSIDVLQDIIREYPDRKDQIRILHHKENKGLPQARRTGMLAATGDYIINFDSDDWVDTSIIELMYNKAIEEQSGIVICDMCIVQNEKRYIKKGCYTLEKKKLIKDICLRQVWSTCNKLIKHNLINENTIFPNGNMGEDMAFIVPLMLKAERFSYIPQPLYYYVKNDYSITGGNDESKILLRYFSSQENIKIVENAFENSGLINEYRDVIDSIKLNSKNFLTGLVHDKKYFRLWIHTYSEINVRILFNKEVSAKLKLKYILTFFHLYP